MNTESHSFGPVYGPERAVGHIIATGNVGSYLKQNQANTYLSIDGGRKWSEIAIGSHIYEISDHGNIIILAKD